MGFDNKESNQTESHYTVSVANILRDFRMPKIIDYLSLDIEGSEAWAFETFPWEDILFRTLTIERPGSKLKEVLIKNNYEFICQHGGFGDELWIHKTFEDYDRVKTIFGAHDQCRNRD